MTDGTEAAAGAAQLPPNPPDLTQQQCSMLAVLEDYSITADFSVNPFELTNLPKYCDELVGEK